MKGLALGLEIVDRKCVYFYATAVLSMAFVGFAAIVVVLAELYKKVPNLRRIQISTARSTQTF